MRQESEPGLFITFEGVDGAGKSLHLGLILDYLRQNAAAEVVATREPGGTGISEKIRDIILDKENVRMTAMTEALLYAAARAQHVQEVILPAIRNGKIVLCDRFLDSSIAYQSAARGISAETVLAVNQHALEGLSPDLTFLLDLSPEQALARKKKAKEPDRLESEELDFYRRVREGYLALAMSEPNRFVVLDTSGEPGDTGKIQAAHECIKKKILDLIKTD